MLEPGGDTAAPSTGAVARLIGVTKRFGHGARSVNVLDGVDLDIVPGEFVCLLGASGCGKTTLLNLIAGLERPTLGEVRLSATRPAVMFQESALMPWLTAAGNVELALRFAGVGRAERQARTTRLLELVRLDGVGDRRPHELSGGMRQRVALARALASTMDGSESGGRALLLMDEPLSALDAITRDLLQGELLRVWEATGSAVVYVTHDVREAVRLGQRVLLLSSRPGTVAGQWHTDGVTGPAELSIVDEITVALRKVIGPHAQS
ncbi:ABC transporter ATP-binding protein [Crossiella sp. NPDC003009]